MFSGSVFQVQKLYKAECNYEDVINGEFIRKELKMNFWMYCPGIWREELRKISVILAATHVTLITVTDPAS
jgi:hypothetical protein